MIQANLPFSTVRCSALKELLEAITCREVKMPSISTLMTTLTSKFDLMKINLKEKIKKQSFICSTTDIWTHRGKSYLGVSIHYIDEEWKRKSYILAFRRLFKRHTYDYLAKCLHDINKEIDLPHEKITHIVTDGGSNFCKAFRIYGRENDFSETLASMAEDEENEIYEEENVVLFNENALLIVNGDANDNQKEPDPLNDIMKDVENAAIQGDQIDFNNDLNFLCDDIILPPQMRCFSHLLNLIGNKPFIQIILYN